MKKIDYKDVAERAFKTFVEAFLSVTIPEVCAILAGGFPESLSVFWAVLSPVVAGALASAISAAWNTIQQWKRNNERDSLS